MSAGVWIGVAALGGLGSLARYHLDASVQRRLAREFPVGTLAVNLAGALALGVLAGAASSGLTTTLAGTATLGSFTTFSTWMLESERLEENGAGRSALANLAGSLVLGFAAAAAGFGIGRAL